MMTKAQTTLYWRLFAAAVRAHEAAQECQVKLSSAEKSALRHRWHLDALGQDKSSTAFTNADVDRVFAHFKLIAEPDDFNAALLDVQAQQDQGDRKRLLWSIQRWPVGYVHKLCADKFDCIDLDSLTTEQLRQLNMTLVNRRRAKQRVAA